MITNMERKPLTKDSFYREGKVRCELWDTEITVFLFEEEVTLEYAERCAAAMNAMPEALIDAICRAAKAYCLDFCESISDEWRAELKLSVPVDANTPPRELLKCFQPTGINMFGECAQSVTKMSVTYSGLNSRVKYANNVR